MKQILQFSSVWMAIVLLFGNGVVGFTPVAATKVHISNSTPTGTIPLVSEWIQTNWPASNSFFNLYTSQDKVFARIWDSLNGGSMYLTTDDGTNWTQIASADSNIDILSMVRLDSKILAGTWNGFYLSTDDGKNWNSATPTGIPADTSIWSIVMMNSTLFAGITGGVYKSLDNGSTWTEVSSGIPVDARITSFVASGNAIFAGSAGKGVFKTTNGGTSWTAINSGLTDTRISQLAVLGARVFAVTLTGVFISDNSSTSWAADNSGLENVNCFLVVNDRLFAGTDDNGVHLSVDSGATWTSFSSGIPASTRIWSMAVSSDGILAGTSSGVWVTASPTKVVVEGEISVPSAFSLKQNFPNPFNATTIISFSIPHASAVSLKVFNSLGQEVESLINRKLDPGNYYIWWNGDKFSSGIYFCRLQSYNHLETIKLILLK